MKILFKYPSRGREQRFFKSLDSIYDNLSDNPNYHISCTLDSDDEVMNNQTVIDRIGAYKNISISFGLSQSKVHAINRSMPDIDWQILIAMSDDMRWIVKNFDEMIRADMSKDLDRLLHYPDQDAKKILATMYIAGRTYYDRFGYIYNPKFKSLWCDNLVQDIAIKLGKYKYCDFQLFNHLCPVHGHLPKDAMFKRQYLDWNEDQQTYLKLTNDTADIIR